MSNFPRDLPIRIKKFVRREECRPCNEDKKKLRERKDIIGGVARKVWPEDKE